MDILIIKNSRKEPLFLVPISWVLAITCVFLIRKGFYPFIAWPLALLFGLGVPFFLLSSGDDEDRLVMNDKGIFDRTLGVGMIPWTDMLEAHIEAKYGNHFICLKLRNPEYYLAKMTERQREKLLQSRELGFTRFNIDVSGAGASMVDILNVVQKMIDRNRPPGEG